MNTPKFKVPTDAATPTKPQFTSNGHWDFPDQMGPDSMFGFIYLIHNTVNNKYYIGKKQYFGTGLKNAGKVSNWKRYTSSCDLLNFDIKENGREYFRYICLEQYKTKTGLYWAEVWSIVTVEATTYPNKWYNGFVERIFLRNKETITSRHKERIKEFMYE